MMWQSRDAFGSRSTFSRPPSHDWELSSLFLLRGGLLDLSGLFVRFLGLVLAFELAGLVLVLIDLVLQLAGHRPVQRHPVG